MDKSTSLFRPSPENPPVKPPQTKPAPKHIGRHAPLWMIASNILNRAGGFIILVVLGHGFSPDLLARYFAALVSISVAVSLTQAGCGPLLVRLAQYRQWRSISFIVSIRMTIALIAIAWIAPQLPPIAWPVLIMPFAAAISPDWLVSARLQFNKILFIGAFGQLAGLGVAFYATQLASATSWLYATAPAISVASWVASFYFAFANPSAAAPAPATVPHPKPAGSLPVKIWPQLIAFTLLAGLLPNIDMALLPASLPQAQQDALLLVHRLLLLAAAMISAISGVLFAQNRHVGRWDFWLILPAIGMALVLLAAPQIALELVFGHSHNNEVGLVRIASFWPLLLALVTRQILLLQERSGHLGTMCIAGIIIVAGAALIAMCDSAIGIMVAMNVKLAVLASILYLAARFGPSRGKSSCRT